MLEELSEKHGLSNYYKGWNELNWNPISFERDYLQEVRRRFVVKTIEEYKPKTILEVGCGLNPMFPYYNEYEKYIILEPIKEFSDKIKENNKLDERVKIFNTKLEYYYSNDKFDMIIVSSLLHEIEDINQFLDCIKFFCNFKTVIHFNVPNNRSFHRLLGKEMNILNNLQDHSETGKKLQRKHEFKDKKLYLLLDRYFEIIEWKTCLIKPFSNEIMEKIITPEIFEGLMKMITYMPELGAELCINCRLK